MLKDAALLQLELGRRALEADLTLKDASAYNVQWRGASPVFIDIGSFERLRPGEPWAGYRQFCMLFLYPLLLQAYKGLPYHAWLRGSLDGIAPSDARAVMSARDRLRRGVLTHVVLHARLQARHGDSGGREVKREMKSAGFGKELLDANAAPAREARAPARVQARADGVDGVRPDQHVHRRGRPPQGRVRPRGGSAAARCGGLGRRLQRRHVLARGGGVGEPRRRVRRRPRDRRRPLPRRCGTRAGRTSCRLS